MLRCLELKKPQYLTNLNLLNLFDIEDSKQRLSDRIIMKQLKGVFIALGIFCLFLLSGCVGNGSNDNKVNSQTLDSQSSIQPSNGNNTNPLNTNESPITSFTLWGTDGDTNTAIAGEITTNDNGNQITIQVPAETSLPAKFYVTYTGADSIINSANNSEVTNHSLQSFDSTPVSYTVTKNNAVQNYTVSVVTRKPYLEPIPNTDCLKDVDSNLWSKSIIWSNDKDDYNKISNKVKFFSDCGYTFGQWSLPSVAQAKALLNLIPVSPVNYRSNPGGTDTKPVYYWFWDVKGFNNIGNGRNLWTSTLDVTDYDNAYMINLNMDQPHSESVEIVSSPKDAVPSGIDGLPVHSGDINDAKTITDFSVENQVGNTVIVGNQIQATISKWVNPQSIIIPVQFNFVTTGGKVSINSSDYINEDEIKLPNNFSQQTLVIPVTVMSNNRDKNIYTLLLKFVPPPPPLAPVIISTLFGSFYYPGGAEADFNWTIQNNAPKDILGSFSVETGPSCNKQIVASWNEVYLTNPLSTAKMPGPFISSSWNNCANYWRANIKYNGRRYIISSGDSDYYEWYRCDVFDGDVKSANPVQLVIHGDGNRLNSLDIRMPSSTSCNGNLLIDIGPATSSTSFNYPGGATYDFWWTVQNDTPHNIKGLFTVGSNGLYSTWDNLSLDADEDPKIKTSSKQRGPYFKLYGNGWIADVEYQGNRYTASSNCSVTSEDKDHSFDTPYAMIIHGDENGLTYMELIPSDTKVPCTSNFVNLGPSVD